MSRHRMIRNMDYDYERDDEEDLDFHRYSISVDDEVPMSPGTAKFMYHRPPLTSSDAQSSGSAKVTEQHIPFTLENDVVQEEVSENQFYLEESEAKPGRISKKAFPQISTTGPPCSNERIVPREPGTQFSAKGISKPPKLCVPEVENLRLSEASDAKETRGESPSRSSTLTPNASYRRLTALAAAQSATPIASPRSKRREKDSKPLINLVVVGHVDAGKSTLMGHLLYQLGYVDSRTMHKYKQESARSGKSSFAYAWVLDDTQEERQRGVTMDIARTSFDTEHRRIVVLDAPGHKDFIPNMITGASQADAGLLVVNSTRGEFETGFDQGGQTREHAMLLRSLGVGELAVAVNKLDTMDWSKQRYDEVCAILQTFLRKQAGFVNVRFVPVSGLDGINLTVPSPADHPLSKWYSGPTLNQLIDEMNAPVRSEDRPLRAVINDVFKSSSSVISLSAKIEAGSVEIGDKVFIMPNADAAVVKAVSGDETSDSGSSISFAGEHSLLTLNAVTTFEPDSITAGHVISVGGKDCLIPGKRFIVRLVVFNITVPIMKGTRADLFAHSLCEPCTIVRLRSVLNKASGEVLKRRPRCLTRNSSGIVDIETDRVVSLEAYSECRALGRITLRSDGHTIAAGIVEEVVASMA